MTKQEAWEELKKVDPVVAELLKKSREWFPNYELNWIDFPTPVNSGGVI